MHILDIMSEDSAAIQLGGARGADPGAVIVGPFGHLFDRAGGRERATCSTPGKQRSRKRRH